MPTVETEANEDHGVHIKVFFLDWYQGPYSYGWFVGFIVLVQDFLA
jgi:hypothetical protein